jgi:hypothetical protein
MTNDRVIKERIREFQIGKDYSVSVEDDGKKSKECYSIVSPKLKMVLRGMVFSSPQMEAGEFGGSFARKTEAGGGHEGNYFSYEESTGNSPDKLVIVGGGKIGQQTEIETGQRQRTSQELEEALELKRGFSQVGGRNKKDEK